MRSKRAPRRVITPDPIYGSQLIAKFINSVMQDGKKAVAQKQVYHAFELIADQSGQDPLIVFKTAIENVKPIMEVRARRVGGAAYQVPMPVRADRRQSLAIRWIIAATNGRSDPNQRTFAEKLAAELIDAANNQGASIRQRELVHRQAEANQAFAHFRW